MKRKNLPPFRGAPLVFAILFFLWLAKDLQSDLKGSAPLSSPWHEISTDAHHPEIYCLERAIRFRPIRVPVPVFFIARDRVEALKRAVSSYRAIATPHRLIVVDNNSTYPPMVSYLRTLEQAGLQVHRWLPEWDDVVRQLDAGVTQQTWMLTVPVNRAVRLYLQEAPSTEYVIVQDSDVSLEGVPPDMLELYAGLLQICPGLTKIGPHLMITDIPASYPFLSGVWDTFSFYYRNQVPRAAVFNGRTFHISIMGIDTHWSMRRAETKFERLNGTAFRTWAPYIARHLDWYQTERSPDTDWYKAHDFASLNHYVVMPGAKDPGFNP